MFLSVVPHKPFFPHNWDIISNQPYQLEDQVLVEFNQTAKVKFEIDIVSRNHVKTNKNT